jgi:hypothetical protein
METARTPAAAALMTRFAERTGLTLRRPPQRYLFTDAFAVCNFLGLARATGEGRWHELAVRLVEQVHHELGRHRHDDRRRGWISGLPEDEAEAHPTRGGLRIGKPLPERRPGERMDPDLEWDRDGQYFHYLTKWMHALDQAARFTGWSTFNVWARELCETAHRAFVRSDGDERRMIWKASVDLGRPLVASMGQHDPLDAFVTCKQLDATAAAQRIASGPELDAIASDFERMIDERRLATTDPLGIGGLLVDACRLAQLDTRAELAGRLLAASLVGLRRWSNDPDLRAAAERRLAFRELGLSIGLAAAAMIADGALASRLDDVGRGALEELAQYLPLRDEIESFWLQPHHRDTRAWAEHADIDEVMLATSLLPEGFLALGGPRARAVVEPRPSATT